MLNLIIEKNNFVLFNFKEFNWFEKNFTNPWKFSSTYTLFNFLITLTYFYSTHVSDLFKINVESRNTVAARRQVLKKNFNCKSAATSNLLEYTGSFASGISPTKLKIAFMATLSLHKLGTIFRSFERAQFRINRVSLYWDLGMLRWK